MFLFCGMIIQVTHRTSLLFFSDSHTHYPVMFRIKHDVSAIFYKSNAGNTIPILKKHQS